MALIVPFGGSHPSIHPSCYIADNATLTGDITIGAHSSIWYQVVIRGDANKIVIGDRVNVQDASIVHGTHGRGDTIIGNDVSIGHRAIIHGCTIADRVLIGMGAIVLDDAIIPEDVIVAAGALVTEGKKLESGFLYAGVPAVKKKEIDPAMLQVYIDGTAQTYVQLAKEYLKIRNVENGK